MIKKVILAVVLILVIILTVRTIHLSRRPPPVKECKATDADFIPLTDERLKRFQDALRIETVSRAMHDYNTEELRQFGDFIVNSFPTIHKSSPLVEWERVNNYSLLYHIKGSNAKLRPYLLMSHLDVVPATNLDEWDAPPFAGNVVDGFIYGRGTIDDKQGVMGILEALEFFLSSGIKPKRSFYIAFGHDEEVTGLDGAAHLAKRLAEKGVKDFEFISDEGMPVLENIIPGVKGPVANIGVTEKGQVIFTMTVEGNPGHSSIPPKESTIGILAKAVHKLESTPHPSMLGTSVEKHTFETLVPEMGIPFRVVMSNMWLFGPAISWFMSLKPHTDAIIRTVTSVTRFNAGVKDNVIPPMAKATVNHRIHPAQSVQEVLDYDKSVIGDPRVKFEITNQFEPYPVAGFSETDFGYEVLKTSVRQVWPDAAVVPAIMVGNTDTRHYLNFTSDMYRFCPTHMFPGDPLRFHGINERISVKNYEQAINFYFHLIMNANQEGVSPAHGAHGEL